MSNYTNGRRAPNVSQYLANLNSATSTQDVSPQDFSIGDDGLDFLTNAEFFDFDNFNVTTDFAPQAQKPAVNNQPYQFGEFQTYASPSITTPPNGLQGTYPPQHSHGVPTFEGDSNKRKASVAGLGSTPVELLDDASRGVAEEDKRRRNTAASARFRVKKKQREQALEKSAKEMSDKVAALEGKVQQLEMENKWLKGLITEKGDAKTLISYEAQAKAREGEERSSSRGTDGVGTAEAEA